MNGYHRLTIISAIIGVAPSAWLTLFIAPSVWYGDFSPFVQILSAVAIFGVIFGSVNVRRILSNPEREYPQRVSLGSIIMNVWAAIVIFVMLCMLFATFHV